MSGVFGPLLTGKDVRDALESTIKTWVRDYVGEVARLSGRSSEDLKPFRSYVSSLDLDKFQSDQLPCCVIVAPGLLTQPELRRGAYNARWGVAVGVVVSGQDRENTFDLVELYTAAVRSLLIHHPSLGGFAEGLEWIGERYDELRSEDLRTIGAGTVQLAVDVTEVQSKIGGPGAPTAAVDPVEDPGDLHTVGSVTITTERKG